MTKKVFYLGTCSTGAAIMKDMNLDDFEKREIKSQAISESEVDEMQALAGSYEALFSRRAMKFRAWGLHEKELSETDYRDLITKEYTFLKRPVFILGNEIFIGNTKKVVEAIHQTLNA